MSLCQTLSLNTCVHHLAKHMGHLAEHVHLTSAFFTRGCCQCFMSISVALTGTLPLSCQHAFSSTAHLHPFFAIHCLSAMPDNACTVNEGGGWVMGTSQANIRARKFVILIAGALAWLRALPEACLLHAQYRSDLVWCTLQDLACYLHLKWPDLAKTEVSLLLADQPWRCDWTDFMQAHNSHLSSLAYWWESIVLLEICASPRHDGHHGT